MSSDTHSETQPLPVPQYSNPDLPDSQPRTWWKSLVTLGVVVAVIGSAAAIISRANSPRAFDPAQTHTITRGDLLVTVTEQGTLESSNNTEIKCKVRGNNTLIWVIESGTEVKAGDELFRLETLLIDDQISERTKYAHLAHSAVARSQANVTRAKLAISEYLEGQFVSSLATLQKDLAIAESKLLSSKYILGYTKMMSKSGYKSELEVEEKEFAVAQADLNLKIAETKIDVLKKFTKEEELATLRGDFAVSKAEHEANKEKEYADKERLNRAKEELEFCTVKADRAGIVIYPTGEQWENAPEIEEGATVHKDQVLLLMPDLTQMQVKVGMHESIVDRIQPGITAIVTLPNQTLEGSISSVAEVAQPAGWWTGNIVKYDTMIELPSMVEGLKPGMSVEVEVIMARYENVIKIPTAAVIETNQGYACWVETKQGTQRRTLQLGDSSDMFIVVESGVIEGDQVILDPLAYIEEAQIEAAEILENTKLKMSDF
ncbi:MAG: hypothetical protein COA78_03065 [Blastopirellula sp.]|nr:MAG: hypothetical protein COA78_03065 [Blastopirellula sp.]